MNAKDLGPWTGEISPRGSITCRLVGGLGNQLFIYATGRAVSIRSGYDLTLDLSAFRASSARAFALGQLDHGARLVHRGKWSTRIAAKLRMRDHIDVFREAQLSYDPLVWEIQPGTTLSGYFQSWRYFQQDRNELLDIIMRPRETSEWFGARRAQLVERREKIVGVHIRRGDYLLPENRGYHGVLSLSYYRAAVDKALRATGADSVLVASDDLEAAEAITRECGWHVKLLRPPSESTPLESVLLLAQCDAVVLSNSSFSWWAGWLSEAEMVVAPRPWYVGVEYDEAALLPQQWSVVGDDGAGA